MYMSSPCTNDGTYNLTVTFKLGMDSDMAQVLVQNRVSLALPVIPALVQNEGITVKKMSPNTLMIVNLVSPDGTLRRHLSEQLRDDLHQGRAGPAAGRGRHHLPGPARLQPAGLARPGQAGRARPQRHGRGQRHQPAERAGRGRADRPAAVPKGQQFQLTINTLGRLTEPEQFADIILKAGIDYSPSQNLDGRRRASGNQGSQLSTTSQTGPQPQAVGIVRAARRGAASSWGRRQYDQSCTLDGKPSVARLDLPVAGLQRPEHRRGVYAKMKELKTRFPDGLDYQIVYDTTPVHPRVGQRSLQHAARRRDPGRHRRAGVPAGLAGA